MCFRHRAGDDFNERRLEALNDSGELYLTHTRADGNVVLRMAIGGTWTAWRHIRDEARRLEQAA